MAATFISLPCGHLNLFTSLRHIHSLPGIEKCMYKQLFLQLSTQKPNEMKKFSHDAPFTQNE